MGTPPNSLLVRAAPLGIAVLALIGCVSEAGPGGAVAPVTEVKLSEPPKEEPKPAPPPPVEVAVEAPPAPKLVDEPVPPPPEEEEPEGVEGGVVGGVVGGVLGGVPGGIVGGVPGGVLGGVPGGVVGGVPGGVVSGAVASAPGPPPTLTNKLDCAFPPSADAAGVDSALVFVRVEIAADGKLTSMLVLKDPGNGFAKAATDCVQAKAKFKAGTDSAGKPRAGSRILAIRFGR